MEIRLISEECYKRLYNHIKYDPCILWVILP